MKRYVNDKGAEILTPCQIVAPGWREIAITEADPSLAPRVTEEATQDDGAQDGVDPSREELRATGDDEKGDAGSEADPSLALRVTEDDEKGDAGSETDPSLALRETKDGGDGGEGSEKPKKARSRSGEA